MQGCAKPHTGSEAAWRRTAVSCLAAFAGALVCFLLMVIVIDPYDSGRFPTFMPSGSADERPPTINVSRGRDPRFNAVLLGSSRAVLADPRRISALTGYRFVQLASEGALVPEQMTFLHWFARNHASVDAIVVATDMIWCDLNPELPGERDFPYGLYADNNFEYLRTTLSGATFDFAKERMLYALGRMPGVDHARFVDIETKYGWRWPDWVPNWYAPKGAAVTTLPALTRFDADLKELPTQPPIVLWMPPYFHDALPSADSPDGLRLAECKAALRRWADARPHTRFLDLAVDTPEAADRRNFLEPIHVSNRFMRVIEVQIAAAVNQVK